MTLFVVFKGIFGYFYKVTYLLLLFFDKISFHQMFSNVFRDGENSWPKQ